MNRMFKRKNWIKLNCIKKNKKLKLCFAEFTQLFTEAAITEQGHEQCWNEIQINCIVNSFIQMNQSCLNNISSTLILQAFKIHSKDPKISISDKHASHKCVNYR